MKTKEFTRAQFDALELKLEEASTMSLQVHDIIRDLTDTANTFDDFISQVCELLDAIKPVDNEDNYVEFEAGT